MQQLLESVEIIQRLFQSRTILFSGAWPLQKRLQRGLENCYWRLQFVGRTGNELALLVERAMQATKHSLYDLGERHQFRRIQCSFAGIQVPIRRRDQCSSGGEIGERTKSATQSP